MDADAKHGRHRNYSTGFLHGALLVASVGALVWCAAPPSEHWLQRWNGIRHVHAFKAWWHAHVYYRHELAELDGVMAVANNIDVSWVASMMPAIMPTIVGLHQQLEMR